MNWEFICQKMPPGRFGKNSCPKDGSSQLKMEPIWFCCFILTILHNKQPSFQSTGGAVGCFPAKMGLACRGLRVFGRGRHLASPSQGKGSYDDWRKGGIPI